MRTRVIGLRVNPLDLQTLDALAGKLGQSRSQAVRYAVRQQLIRATSATPPAPQPAAAESAGEARPTPGEVS